MTTSIEGVSRTKAPGTLPSPTTNPMENPDFKKEFEKVATNILQDGQGLIKESLDKFFNDEEEPDPDDPDSEPL